MSAAIGATVFCRHDDGSNPKRVRPTCCFRVPGQNLCFRTHNTYASLRHWLGSATRIRRLPAGSLPSRFLLADPSHLIDTLLATYKNPPPALLQERSN